MSLILRKSYKVLLNSNIRATTFCTQTTSDKAHFDIIISGGGLVGTTLACSLASNGKLASKRILLLEGAPKFKRTNIEEYSNRVSALSDGTIELMRDIGAWPHIAGIRYKPVLQMQVWDACSDSHITFRDDSNKPLAYIVENDVVLEAVYKQLENKSSVTIENDARIEKVVLSKNVSLNDKPKVVLKTGQEFSCDLLIGADGYNSLVRRAMNGSNLTVQYRQMGVVATVELAEANTNDIAWQRFLPSGPVALLPLDETKSSLVWSTGIEHAKQLLAMEPQQFIDSLNEAYYKTYKQDELVKGAMQLIEGILGKTMGGAAQYPPRVCGLSDKSRAAFPLGFGHVSTYVGKNVAIIGDAAHRVHPMAGQGVNLGFGDVKCLTEILAEAAYRGADLGDISHLTVYEKERLCHNLPIMLGVHGLQRLYGTDFSPIVALRSVGLGITNAFPPLKKIFMDQARV